MREYRSWGNYPRTRQEAHRIDWRPDSLPPVPEGSTVLPYGLGRSYGDSCLNDGGHLLDTAGLNRYVDFDPERGLLRCEAGVSLAAILETFVPRGWFLPVTPGTKFVTVAGAVANDVHGKNHHGHGTFGCFVTRFELLRSDGRRLICSQEENRELFAATIGGLGLTGLVTWVELRMKRVPGSSIDCESIRFGSLDEFFELAAESDVKFEYTAAWVDCLARGAALGRGIFLRGNHAAGRRPVAAGRNGGSKLSIPVYAPELLLNPWTIRAFNTLYYHRQRRKVVRKDWHYEPFFYPLDAVGDWNRLYGRRGFLQYQCVVPLEGGREAMREILRKVADRGEGSFLGVLKLFGEVPSPGLLSFPRPGVTLCLDFANRGGRTLDLLDELDAIVRQQGGRVYPAKDARMSAESFQLYFPEWRDFARHVDPAFSSSFWRRVTPPPVTG